MLHGFVALDRPGVHREIWVMAHLGDTLPYAVAGLLCIGVALARGTGLACAGRGLPAGGHRRTTQALKHLLAQPRLEHWLPEQVAATRGRAGTRPRP